MAGKAGFLFQHHHARAGNNGALALVCLDSVGEQTQQSRLAGAIAPDQRQPFALSNVNIESAEQPAASLNDAEVFIR